MTFKTTLVSIFKEIIAELLLIVFILGGLICLPFISIWKWINKQNRFWEWLEK